MTASLSRRTALLAVVAGAVALGGCGRRGGLELPGETPATIGGPTPPNLPPRAEAAADPANPAQREAGPRRDYDRNRPVGRGQLLPSGQFILDPLL
ncbi:LPS translocon maturation chaperone LptM [Phreatobacter oligotrophus]|uniref:LPS translocon maturation chaperone LptM n=1 Tax=Phreatobacter oligotrophus TaxID=1122261 RepID=UPI002352716E|nr:lipoprotein [Phreatobacter oligotrophus]MBX9992850.1 lipoprotein [Phreatobacter oligotrophus]